MNELVGYAVGQYFPAIMCCHVQIHFGIDICGEHDHATVGEAMRYDPGMVAAWAPSSVARTAPTFVVKICRCGAVRLLKGNRRPDMFFCGPVPT